MTRYLDFHFPDFPQYEVDVLNIHNADSFLRKSFSVFTILCLLMDKAMPKGDFKMKELLSDT